MNKLNFSPLPDTVRLQIEEALKNLDSPRALSEMTELLQLDCLISFDDLPVYERIRTVFDEVLADLEKINPDYANMLRGRRWEKLSVDEMIQKKRPQQWSASQFYKVQSLATEEFITLLWEKEMDARRTHMDEKAPSASPVVSENQKIRWIRMVIYPVIILIVLALVYWYSGLIDQGEIGKEVETNAPARSITVTTGQVLVEGVPTATDPAPTSEPTTVPFFCDEAEQIPVDGSVYRFVRSQGVSIFDPENTAGILNKKVRSVLIDRTGLWLGYFATDQNNADGLGHFDKKNKLISDCNHPGFTATTDVNALAVDQDGRLWVGTEKNGISMFDGQNWRRFTRADGLPGDWIYDLYVDQDNRVYASTWDGIGLYENGQWKTLYQVGNHTIFDNRVHAVRIDSGGNIWVGQIESGLSVYWKATDSWQHLTRESGDIHGNQARAITVQPAVDGRHEAVWIAFSDGGLERYSGGEWTHFGQAEGLPSDDAKDVEVDSLGRVWVATTGGVSYYDGARWIVYDTLDTLSIAFGVDCPDKSCSIDADNVFTGTNSMGLTHSRLPLEGDGLRVEKVCFISMDQVETCPDLVKDEAGRLVIAAYPRVFKPGDKFYLSVTVSPIAPYELLDSRGDMLVNTDVDETNLFGAFERIPVVGTIDSGQMVTIIDYNNPLTAPVPETGSGPVTYSSNWRVWMHTRYIYPSIRVEFTVK